MPDPRVTAVMVTYNSRGTLPRALAGLKESFDQGLCQAVVVDNDSKDGSPDYVRTGHPWATLLDTKQNSGFGRGNNRGFAHAPTEYVLLLNPDAQITPDALRALVAFLDAHPEAGIAGPAIREPGQPDQPAFRFPTPGTVLRSALGRLGGASARLARPIERRRYQVDWLCGAALLIRRSLLDTLQGFDPRFFLYFEETDLCRRARAAGQPVYVVGDVVAGHYAGSSAKATKRLMWEGCIAEHYFKSRYYYLTKHHGRLAATVAELGEIALLAVFAAARWLLRKPSDGKLRLRLASPILKMPAVVEGDPAIAPIAPQLETAPR
jgi:N-acetylglucosaminyl-diphospho-decaprenol L-rhamnosyltransferase